MTTPQKINRIKQKLAEMQEYKRLLASEGILPDTSDKERESELIRQLLRLEKGLPAKPAPKQRKKTKTNVTGSRDSSRQKS